MPPKEKKESTSGFTARDLDLIAAAIQSTKAPVEVRCSPGISQLSMWPPLTKALH